MRSFLPYILIAAVLGLTAWALSFSSLEPADFTFCNGTEIKSVDPAIVTGQPEGRIIWSIYECLVTWHPETLEPLPGVAENVHGDSKTNRWECLSDDKKVYTFKLRKEARWSDGSPVTAEDFVYSFARFLDPATPNEYVKLLTDYVVNASEHYSSGKLKPGNPVQIELVDYENEKIGVPGPLKYGKLIATQELPKPKSAKEEDEPPRIYTVEVDGQRVRFQPDVGRGSQDPRDCKRVCLDFREVGVKAIDSHTLEIRIKSPTPYFLNLLGFYPLSPVNRRCVETHGFPAWTKPGNIVTNGPFILKERRFRDRIRLVKNPQYWDKDNVKLEVIDALPVDSDVTMLNMYMAGQVDWITNLPATMVPELLARRERQIAAGKKPDFEPAPELTVNFYRLNVTKPGLNNKLVRQALAMALNKEEVVKTVLQAGEVPAYSLVPPGLPGYNRAQAPPYNPEKARQLLAQAGYPNGKGPDGRSLRVEITFNTNETHQSVAELIQRHWRLNLGVDAVLRNMEWNSYQAAQQQLEYQVCRAGWIGDYSDPNTFLDLFMADNPNNQTGWKHEPYDKLVRDAAFEPDSVKRMQMLHDAEAIFLDEMPVIPLYYRVTKNLVRPYVSGFYNNVQDVHPLKYISVDKEARKRVLAEEVGR
ncbi:MAG: peptide ABC transporter substrate-binding protein [Planctomycetia bacterium]|nr:peptide ABC transporter substrate-binding protein [Planctomycetia bacterium]